MFSSCKVMTLENKNNLIVIHLKIFNKKMRNKIKNIELFIFKIGSF
jgi:hypothetical protein